MGKKNFCITVRRLFILLFPVCFLFAVTTAYGLDPCSIIEVTPAEYDFGNAQMGSSSSVIITISNINGHILNIWDVSLTGQSNPEFTITEAPIFPVALDWNGNDTTYVEVTFAPAKGGYFEGILLITSDDLVKPSIEVPLTGKSVYTLPWSTFDGGGGRSSGGQYTLTGTIGQPDAAYSAGADYELLGGLWPGGPLCFVEFEDFARFAEHWLQTGCNESNDWCGGADLTQSDGVNWTDLEWFTEDWLYMCPYNWPLK